MKILEEIVTIMEDCGKFNLDLVDVALKFSELH